MRPINYSDRGPVSPGEISDLAPFDSQVLVRELYRRYKQAEIQANRGKVEAAIKKLRGYLDGANDLDALEWRVIVAGHEPTFGE